MLGKKGEKIARIYLERLKYKFITANFRTRWGEIDLIMKKNNQVVFVEVKTRTVGNIIAPNYMLSEHKLRRLERAVDIYTRQNNVKDWRFMLVSITKNKNRFFLKMTDL